MELFGKGAAWQDFQELENEMVRILPYVPLRKVHDDVWSRKFGIILDSTGSAVDSFFKVAIAEGRLFKGSTAKKVENLDITDYRKIVEPQYRLSGARITVSDGIVPYSDLDPFEVFAKDESPGWWNAYQDYKHNRYSLVSYATLGNSIQALGALFILNILHKENQPFLIEQGILTGRPHMDDTVFAGCLSKSKFGIAANRGDFEVWARSRLFGHHVRADLEAVKSPSEFERVRT